MRGAGGAQTPERPCVKYIHGDVWEHWTKQVSLQILGQSFSSRTIHCSDTFCNMGSVHFIRPEMPQPHCVPLSCLWTLPV